MFMMVDLRKQEKQFALLDEHEVLKKMEQIAIESRDDKEKSHGDADDLLCGFLRRLGYIKIVDEFHRVGKYYS